MKRLLVILAVSLAGCEAVPEQPMTAIDRQNYAICVAKGLDYLKAVEHFPYLTDSSDPSYLVTVHVGNQCLENSGAFGPLNGPTIVPADTQALIAR